VAEKTEISWTDATFNPWWGCAKVSPACDRCYAERDAKRYAAGQVLWGVDAERRTFGDKHWKAPTDWNKKAAREGKRMRVFCASMADVFDKNAPEGARDRLWALIKATPWLDWLLLTKRIGNAKGMLPADWGDGYANVVLMSTVIDQDEADRDVPKLLATPARRRGLSIEPQLGPIDLTKMRAFGLHGFGSFEHGVDWVIVGGESGAGARPIHPDWVRSLRDQCAAAGVPFHFKQWGEWSPIQYVDAREHTALIKMTWTKKETLIGGPKEGTQPTNMQRLGKKAAGRLLDGVEHNGFPGAI